jgi:hypothetical protein
MVKIIFSPFNHSNMNQQQTFKHAVSFQPKLRSGIPYTVVLSQNNQTQLMEIYSTKRKNDILHYKVTALHNGLESLPVPNKKRSIAFPTGQPWEYWLIFEGHRLPLLVNGCIGGSDRWSYFRFISHDLPSLQAFLLDKCLNPSIQAFSKIYYYPEHGYCDAGTPLFPPEITLFCKGLYQQQEIYPGLTYAINDQGEAVLHDGKYCRGHAWGYCVGDSNYRVRIHDALLTQGQRFVRYKYSSQERANTGLLAHAQNLYRRAVVRQNPSK